LRGLPGGSVRLVASARESQDVKIELDLQLLQNVEGANGDPALRRIGQAVTEEE
jgi:hypothetical protein